MKQKKTHPASSLNNRSHVEFARELAPLLFQTEERTDAHAGRLRQCAERKQEDEKRREKEQ